MTGSGRTPARHSTIHHRIYHGVYRWLGLVALSGGLLFWIARALSGLGEPAAAVPPGEPEAEAALEESGAAPGRSLLQTGGPTTTASAGVEATTPVIRRRLMGRVVDSASSPVADARVTASLLDSRGRPVEQASFTTGEDGNFDIELNLETDSRAEWLVIAAKPANPFLCVVERRLDAAQLTTEALDLGDLALLPAGVLEGRVRTSDGSSPTGTIVRLTTRRPPFPVAEVAKDGVVLIPHIPPMVESVRAKLAGFTDSVIGPVEIRALQRTVVQIELERAIGLTGRILDTTGGPVVGAQVIARPVGRGSASETRSGADGRFALEPGTGEAFLIDVRAAGYASLSGTESSAGRPFERGAEAIELVLHPLPERSFRLVDSATRAPVERFGFLVAERARSFPREQPVLCEYPEGRFATQASEDHELLLVAPGYADRSWTVANAAAGGAPDEIVMSPASRVRGRVLGPAPPATLPGDGTVPLSGVTVQLRRTYSRALLEAEGLDPASFAVPNPDRFANRDRVTATDAEGHFMLDGLASHVWTLQVLPPATAKLALVGEQRVLQLARAHDEDVGDIVLAAGNRLEGRVLTGAGISSAGLLVNAGSGPTRRETRVTPEGAYSIESLPPGSNSLWIPATPGILAMDRTFVVEVAETGVTRFDLDLTVFEPTTLEVVVTEARRGVPDLVIEVRAPDDDWMIRFDPTDVHGRTAGTCPAGDDVIVTAAVPPLVRASARASLLRGSSNHVQLELNPATLELVFPDPWDPPEHALAQIAIRGPWSAPLTEAQHAKAKSLGMPTEFFSRGTLTLLTSQPDPVLGAWTASPVRIEGIAPGELEITAQVWTGTSADDESPRNDLLRGTCVVEPGGIARCELRVIR